MQAQQTSADARDSGGAIQRPISHVLRIEGLMGLLLVCVLYHNLGFSWISFALWFLLPDVAIVVYALGQPRIGMWAYNITHSTIGPALLALVGLLGLSGGLPLALIWFAHIGFDRALGFGLKFPQGFGVTHLGLVRGLRQKQ